MASINIVKKDKKEEPVLTMSSAGTKTSNDTRKEVKQELKDGTIRIDY